MPNEISSRPEFPAEGICSGGVNAWYDIEENYTRTSTAEFKKGALRVWNDGWDDMSEGGDEHYVSCQSCGAEFDLPAEVEYDG